MKKIIPAVATLLLLSNATSAQSTFNKVYDIFQANCTVGCHNGSDLSGNLDLNENGNKTAVYNNLIEVGPTNPAALAKGNKLVDPGYPYRSFLLRKCSTTSWDNTFGLSVDEGSSMPEGQTALAKDEIELIRQWILFGAPSSGQVVSPQLLTDYYAGMGKAPINRPPAPAPGEGYQIRTGPFFLPPGQEIEMYRKYQVESPALEVHRIDDYIDNESHHYLLFQFEPGSDVELADGFRVVTFQNVFPDQTKYLTGWVDSDSTILPAGTAYHIHENPVYDLNYHIINYDTDSILQADAYINIYTQELGIAEAEMHSELIIQPTLFILNNGQEYTFSDAIYSGNNQNIADDDIWNIWFLSSHTHKYGTSYNIYKREANGGKGEILYDGNYNTNYTFNQGYYDWQHPANRYFEPQMPVSMKDGLIQEAKYKINNPNETAPFITFGLTTDDEMMLYFIQYTVTKEGDTSGTGLMEREVSENGLSVYPNPYTDNATIRYKLENGSQVKMAIYNAVGAKVAELVNQYQNAGEYTLEFSGSENNLKQGVYFINMQIDERVVTKRIVQLH